MAGLKDTQEIVDNWIKEFGVRYFNELTNMAQLTEEVGEVARIIARRYGEQSEKESDKDKDLGEELADVIFVAVCLANQTGIDLDEFLKRIEEKEIKEKLKTLTNDAYKKSIFGAPTYVVNNKNYWGQDRFEYAIDEINSTS